MQAFVNPTYNPPQLTRALHHYFPHKRVLVLTTSTPQKMSLIFALEMHASAVGITIEAGPVCQGTNECWSYFDYLLTRFSN